MLKAEKIYVPWRNKQLYVFEKQKQVWEEQTDLGQVYGEYIQRGGRKRLCRALKSMVRS